jgi:hypothetical protein
MALVLADRVRDTTTTTGTGTVTLSGTAPTGYQTFGAAIGNGNTTYYTINAGSQWEVGLGTYSSTGPTLARTTVLSSSNGGSLVDFSTGTKDVFVTYPAEKSINEDASGNVGIGTTAPAYKLDVAGIVNTSQSFRYGASYFGSGSDYFTSRYLTNIIYNVPTGSGFVWAINGGDTMTLNSSGNVGIGTSSPAQKLSVNGNIVTAGEVALSGADFVYSWAGGTTGQRRAGFYLDGSNQVVRVYTAQNEVARFDASGNVGIGTSSPSSYLAKLAVIGNATLGQGGKFYQFDASDFTGRYMQAVTNAIVFGKYQAGGDVEQMRIDSSGNVGIGTSSPAQKLDVNSGATANTVNIISTTTTAYSPSGYNGGAARVFMRGGNSTNSFTGTQYTHGGSFEAFFGAVQNSSGLADFVFQGYNGSAYEERMCINAAGNLLVGRTSGTGARVDVYNSGSGDAAVRIGNAQNGFTTDVGKQGATAYGANAAGDGFLYSSTSLSIMSDNAAGVIKFSTGGNTERARITSAGFLLVGTTATLSGNTSNEFKTTTAGSWPLTINSNDRGILHRQSSATTGFYEYFEYNGGTNNGSISYSGGTTAYNTTSDYRLKDIDGPLKNSGAYIDALKPVEGWWKADGKRFIGFLAHQVQEVSQTPVVVGEKDGAEMQQMDYSAPELIANLIAEVQSLRARVAQLEGN